MSATEAGELVLAILGAFSLLATRLPNVANNPAAQWVLTFVNVLGLNVGKAANAELPAVARSVGTVRSLLPTLFVALLVIPLAGCALSTEIVGNPVKFAVLGGMVSCDAAGKGDDCVSSKTLSEAAAGTIKALVNRGRDQEQDPEE